MSFKMYFNKKTKHPSISLSGKDKKKWENMEMTHHPTKKHAYIEIITISSNGKSQSYVRKYIRKDNKGTKGKLYKNTKILEESETKVRDYIKKNKKR
jgi:hypothetical protein